MDAVAERKPKTDKPADEPKKPARSGRAINVWLSDQLYAALEAYQRSHRPRPKTSDAVRTAIEDFLAAQGFWEPPDETEDS